MDVGSGLNITRFGIREPCGLVMWTPDPTALLTALQAGGV